MIRVAVLCHDLGKLTEQWQRDAWKYLREWAIAPENTALLDDGEKGTLEKGERTYFLARFPANKHPPLPGHAAISAYLIADSLRQKWGNWGLAAALAIGHHHVVRTREVPPYRMSNGWLEHLESIFESFDYGAFPLGTLDKLAEQPSCTNFPVGMTPLENERMYTVYVVISRLLNLADRMAAGGGENAILDYEIWRAHL